jgi:AP-3 complex subunit mu
MESLVITQETGITIIEKHWKSQLNTPVLLSSFWLQRHEPIIKIHDVTMLSIQTNGLIFIALTQNDTFPLGIFYQLELLLELFVDYFGSISEQVLKDNFSIIYELLEEWIDFGSPYITEKSMLKQLVPPPSLLSTVINAVSITSGPSPASLASHCPWRNLGITYTHNEIFFDVVEELDCIVDRHGTLLNGTIFGQIECLSRLSGMPELILILNKKPIMGFHQCVNMERYIQNDSISFVPPDGSFTLLDYTYVF